MIEQQATKKQLTTEQVINHTKNFVTKLIVAHNICPFAKRELERGSIRYVVANKPETTATEDDQMAAALHLLLDECQYLNENPETELVLLMYPYGFNQFERYLDLVDLANALLIEQNYEGVYQLATLHPNYCFEDELISDPANFTNRSPYPTLHIIREESLEKALEHYVDAEGKNNPEGIPIRNIAYTRAKGAEFFVNLLAECTNAR